MAEPRNHLLGPLLKEVSRSFYLTLRVLPSGIRSQIGLAYLLARTTDTIADTGLVAPEKRLQALKALRERIMGVGGALDFNELRQHQGSAAERTLLEKCESVLGLLETLTAEDRQLVRKVLGTITSGQELDLQRFGGASADRIVALRSADELDDYTYRVAGCVGEFWTKICLAHLFAATALDKSYLLANGVCFGQGLQLVNVLRDLPADLRNGRCYLPGDQLTSRGLAPEDLLKPENESRLRPIYDTWLERAESHLSAGWDYTNALPRGSVRVRLACAWPIQIGLETTKLLRAGPILDPKKRVKVTRGEVKKLILRSVLLYPFPAWRRLVRTNAKKPPA